MRDDYDVVVADEVHRYRSFSKRYRALKYVSKNSVFRLGLTGTLIDKSLTEMFDPMLWVSRDCFWGTKNRDVFLRAFAVPDNPKSPYPHYEMPLLMVKKLLPDFRQAIHVYISDLIKPPTHKKIVYPLTKTQRGLALKLIEKKRIEGLEEMQVELGPAHIPDKIRQIETGFLLWGERVFKRYDTLKFLWLKRLTEKLKGQRLLIWYRYIEEKNLIQEALPESVPYTATALELFREDRIKIIYAHPKSAGAGIDFSCADASLFLTHNPSNIDLMQAFYRLSKVGNEKEKFCYHFVSKSSWGAEEHRKMNKKMSYFYELFTLFYGESK